MVGRIIHPIGRWAAVVSLMSGEAHAGGRGHEAVFAAPVEKSQIVVRDLLSQCDGASCLATRESDSRPVIVCMALAQTIGPVLEFSTRGLKLDAEALARCNAPRDGEASVSSR